MSVVAPQRRLRTGLPTAIVAGSAQVTMTAGEPYSAYRCPFVDDPADHHWHVGHTVSIEGLAAIALAIRQRFQEAE